MGFLILGAALIAGIISMALGLLGFFLHRKAWKEHGKGSWKLYGVIAGITVAAFLVAAKFSIPQAIDGAPTEDDYLGAMIAFSLVAAAPGAGLLFGALAALKPSSNDSPENGPT